MHRTHALEHITQMLTSDASQPYGLVGYRRDSIVAKPGTPIEIRDGLQVNRLDYFRGDLRLPTARRSFAASLRGVREDPHARTRPVLVPRCRFFPPLARSAFDVLRVHTQTEMDALRAVEISQARHGLSQSPNICRSVGSATACTFRTAAEACKRIYSAEI